MLQYQGWNFPSASGVKYFMLKLQVTFRMFFEECQI